MKMRIIRKTNHNITRSFDSALSFEIRGMYDLNFGAEVSENGDNGKFQKKW
jgi:hypothetical protein